MKSGNPSAAGAGRSFIALIVTAGLVVGGCGRVSRNDPGVAAITASDPRELERSPAEGALGGGVRRYGPEVPVAYYGLSFTMSKRTGGITPPVQARLYAYMGLALYESLVAG